MTVQGGEFEREVARLKQATDTALDRALAACPGPGRLIEAMRYCALGSGKRVRSILTLLTMADLGRPAEAAMSPAIAVEFVHAASLILDDLPAMDDAKLRRGRPTCHLAFGQDTAILAAIALMNLAYDTVARDGALPDNRQAITILTEAIGPMGLAGGQWSDLHALGPGADAEQVTRAHAGKTGALFAAALGLGAVAAGAPPATVESLRRCGMSTGLAFQIWDDLLDAKARPEAIGKDTGRDAGKATLVSVLGPAEAAAVADRHLAAARAELASAGIAGMRLARYLDAMIATLLRPLGHTPIGEA